MNDLTLGTLFFMRLGLNFVRMSENGLKLVFTQVDKRNSDREFTFCVHITTTDDYLGAHTFSTRGLVGC